MLYCLGCKILIDIPWIFKPIFHKVKMAVLSGLFQVFLFIVLGMYNFGQRIAFAISQVDDIAPVTQRLDFLMFYGLAKRLLHIFIQFA